MGRFKKVEDTEQSSVVNRALFKSASVQADPYAGLAASAETRRANLARETAGYREEMEAAESKPWERLSSAQALTSRKFAPEDDQMSNMRPEDSSGRGIRRAGYFTDDESTSFRPQPSDMFNDPIATALRGASMWMGDTDELDGLLTEMAEKDNNQFDMRTSREKQEARHNKWEADKMNELSGLRQSQFSSTRAHQIVKAHHENVAAGRFGMVDEAMIDEHEQQRLTMAENRRQQKLAIKENHVTSREARHSEWEKQALSGLRSSTVQDRRAVWADELARLAGE